MTRTALSTAATLLLLGSAALAHAAPAAHAAAALPTAATPLSQLIGAAWRGEQGVEPSSGAPTPQPLRPGLTGGVLRNPRWLTTDQAEFVLWSTVYGVALGSFVTDALEIVDPRLSVSTVVLTTGALGFGAWSLAQRGYLSAGASSAVTWGVFWGTWHAEMIAAEGSVVDEAHPGPLLLGGVVGGAMGAAWGLGLQPERGAVAFANSGAIWAQLLAAALIQPQWPDPDRRAPRIAIASVVGASTFGAIAQHYELTRGEAAVADLFAVGGALLGLLIAVDSNGDVPAILAGCGAATGLLVGTLVAVRRSRRDTYGDSPGYIKSARRNTQERVTTW